MCFAKKSTDSKKKERRGPKKIKSDPSKARERIHGCLTMKNDEINTNELCAFIEKRKKPDGY
jgi:hypothetical protein